jgi:integrase
VRLLPGAYVRRGFLSSAQVVAILAALPPHHRAIVGFLHLTGWRRGEALALEWARVHWESQEIRLDASKTGDPRCLVFSTYPELKGLLDAQRHSADTIQRDRSRVVSHVFHHRNGRPIRRGALQRAWELAREAAGCPGALLHDLRRTLVRQMERAGVPRSVAMTITGHRSEAVYKRYAIVARDDQEAGVGKLSQSLGTQDEAPLRFDPARKKA